MRIFSIKEILKMEKRSYREQEGVFFIEGKKIIDEAIRARLPISQFLATEKFVREQDFFHSHNIEHRLITFISDHNAERLSDTKTPSGVFAIIEKPQLALADLLSEKNILAVDGVRDPGNLGTMIRTADWFGVKAIIVSREGVDPYNDKVIRATMGSLFHLKIFVSNDFTEDIHELKKNDFLILATRPEAEVKMLPTEATAKDAKLCIVLGSESEGTSSAIDELADVHYAIPKYGEAESLNVAVSFGIMMYELARSRAE
jgi:TrmH family RNA methyltransferase